MKFTLLLVLATSVLTTQASSLDETRWGDAIIQKALEIEKILKYSNGRDNKTLDDFKRTLPPSVQKIFKKIKNLKDDQDYYIRLKFSASNYSSLIDDDKLDFNKAYEAGIADFKEEIQKLKQKAAKAAIEKAKKLEQKRAAAAEQAKKLEQKAAEAAAEKVKKLGQKVAKAAAEQAKKRNQERAEKAKKLEQKRVAAAEKARQEKLEAATAKFNNDLKTMGKDKGKIARRPSSGKTDKKPTAWPKATKPEARKSVHTETGFVVGRSIGRRRSHSVRAKRSKSAPQTNGSESPKRTISFEFDDGAFNVESLPELPLP